MDLHSFTQRHLLNRSRLSDILSPLGELNALIQAKRRQKLARSGWKAPCKIVSVGNIVSGGSGKTPFCVYLAGLLTDMGLRVAVSHRGYKSRLENTPTLVSNRDEVLLAASSAGDEAELLATRLPGIPVVVGKARKAAISLLLAEFPDLDLVLLDDSFQHLKIARDLDFVCFDAMTGLGNGRLLPAGYLREPLSALQSASEIVIISKANSETALGLHHSLESLAARAIHCEFRPRDLINAEGESQAANSLDGKKLILLSGIAAPDSFEASVRALGLTWLHHFRFSDHYHFADKAQIRRMTGLARKYGVEAMLCTQKDLAKLKAHDELRPKLLALRMDIACADDKRLENLLRQALK